MYSQQAVKVYDHDFYSLAEAIAIPHGIYDLKYNFGYITINTSHDTSKFACDCVRLWWQNHAIKLYAHSKKLLILCDCGGSNSSRHYIFKEALQSLANDLGLAIRIAHYPPYTSKYNPIEHRLFPHVTRACEGVILDSVETFKMLISRTKTKTGLKVFANVIAKHYEKGQKADDNFKQAMPIVFDDFLPSWNYTAVPQ